jgi:hypothetical protein
MAKIGSEPWVKEGIKKFLDSLGAWHYMPVQSGLGVGGIPDHIACVPVTITPQMVGRTVGLFFAIEAKEAGVIDELRRQAAKGGKHAHPAEDGSDFISNRPLQTMQAEGIHRANGQCWIIDSPMMCQEAHQKWWRWLNQ